MKVHTYMLKQRQDLEKSCVISSNIVSIIGVAENKSNMIVGTNQNINNCRCCTSNIA